MIVNTFRAMIDLAPCYSPLLDRFVQKKKKVVKVDVMRRSLVNYTRVFAPSISSPLPLT